MSLDYQTYLGPYFVCKVKKTTQTETYRGCANPECKLHRLRILSADTNKFCSACGRPLGYCGREEEADDIDPNDVSEAVHGRLFNGFGLGITTPEGHRIWLGNMTKDKVGMSFNPTSREQVTNFFPDDVPNQMKDLIRVYAKEFATLKKMYGEENVSVKWGLINQIW